MMVFLITFLITLVNDLHVVQALLESLPGVARVRDLHVWALDTSEIAMTVHLVMPRGHADDAFLQHATEQLHDHPRQV